MYSQFIRNTEVVKYGSGGKYFYLNLSEIKGWDKVVVIPETSGDYQIYYNELLVSDELIVSREYYDGDYMYYRYFDNNIVAGEDIITMHKFNLESNYDQNYFDLKEIYINENYEDIIIAHDLNYDYETNLDIFLEKAMIK